MGTSVEELVHRWEPARPPEVAARLVRAKIEDDSLRDGLQGAFVTRPSIAHKIELLHLTAAIGTEALVVGFPASSPQELADVKSLIREIDSKKLDIVPRCLARALTRDVECIADLNADSECSVWADFFVGISPLRRHIEAWTLDDIVKRVQETGETLRKRNTSFGISLEDATRAPPEDLDKVMAAAVDAGARILMLCDTVGASTPRSAAQITEHTREFLDRRGLAEVEIWWHGHNDKGLATANSLASVEAGADAISGTFNGLGERCGNTPLEQILMNLHQAGSTHYRIDRIPAYCDKLSEYSGIPISENAPITGRQAFSTSAGTHAAAVLKAKARGGGLEDHVFSAVPAGHLGRVQEIIIGPTSGLASARYVLGTLGLEASEDNAKRLIGHAKAAEKYLQSAEIVQLFATPQ